MRLQASVGHAVRRTAERVPTAEAVVDVDSGARLTHGELWAQALRVAGGLVEAGVAPGDRVAIRLPNGVPWILAFVGTLAAGAVAVPINTRLVEDEVAYLLADSGARVVIDDPSRLPDGSPTSRLPEDAESLAALFYTSGTTGRPKGAMLSHRAVLAGAEQCRIALGLDLDEATRGVVAAPLFHVLACGMQLVPALVNGGCVAVLPGFQPEAWLRTIRTERVDILNGVPAMYAAALAHPSFADLDVSRIRVLSYGAAPTPPAQARALRAAFPHARLNPGFGLTEAPAVTGLADEDALEHCDSVGVATEGTELRIIDQDADGVGQLLVRGPGLMSGYWNRPEETARALRDGWLHTGDLVRMDGAGRVRIMDRRTDLINRGGENVYSVEVEAVLAAFPGVAEVAVVGVPDERLGQRVGAVVVPRPDAVIDVDALLGFATERLARFKIPQHVVVLDEPLPRNPAGKVAKRVLRTTIDWKPVDERNTR